MSGSMVPLVLTRMKYTPRMRCAGLIGLTVAGSSNAFERPCRPPVPTRIPASLQVRLSTADIISQFEGGGQTPRYDVARAVGSDTRGEAPIYALRRSLGAPEKLHQTHHPRRAVAYDPRRTAEFRHSARRASEMEARP